MSISFKTQILIAGTVIAVLAIVLLSPATWFAVVFYGLYQLFNLFRKCLKS